MDKSPELQYVYNTLTQVLEKNDFVLEKRPFRPHLTLARKVIVKQGFDLGQVSREIEPILAPVGSIELMQSSRINGRLTYTSICTKALEVK